MRARTFFNFTLLLRQFLSSLLNSTVSGKGSDTICKADHQVDAAIRSRTSQASFSMLKCDKQCEQH